MAKAEGGFGGGDVALAGGHEILNFKPQGRGFMRGLLNVRRRTPTMKHFLSFLNRQESQVRQVDIICVLVLLCAHVAATHKLFFLGALGGSISSELS